MLRERWLVVGPQKRSLLVDFLSFFFKDRMFFGIQSRHPGKSLKGWFFLRYTVDILIE